MSKSGFKTYQERWRGRLPMEHPCIITYGPSLCIFVPGWSTQVFVSPVEYHIACSMRFVGFIDFYKYCHIFLHFLQPASTCALIRSGLIDQLTKTFTSFHPIIVATPTDQWLFASSNKRNSSCSVNWSCWKKF